DDYKASSYQRYQGEKLAKRFNAFSYWYLSKAMDSHHLGRNREGLKEALGRITSSALVIGINTDNLFPVKEQVFLFNHIHNAQLEIVDSEFGHDGFLTETIKINQLVKRFINSKVNYKQDLNELVVA
ncbi:MAG: homoserine O-acetyltransferase, partial [Cyclobacteriaceae bacterium]